MDVVLLRHADSVVLKCMSYVSCYKPQSCFRQGLSSIAVNMVRQCLDIFPWSDSDDSEHPEVQAQSLNVVPSSCFAGGLTEQADHSSADEVGPEEDALAKRVIGETLTASKILWHCVDTINFVRGKCGGPALCVFKIGLTANPIKRREAYRKQNFKQFVIIHEVTRSELLGMLEMLEAALIAQFYDCQRCCRNKQLGGESMREKSFVARFEPPYYAYVAATNASQREPILG